VTEAASAILSRNILSILRRTAQRVKSEIEEYFINERIARFQQGWPIYIHFEFKNNLYLYNYDSVKWMEYIHKFMKKYSNKVKKGEKELEVTYKFSESRKVKEFIMELFYLKTVSKGYVNNIKFGDGRIEFKLLDGSFVVRYSGERMGEISPVLIK